MHALAALAVVRFGLTLSVGPEYDTNANRAEVVANVEAPDHPVGSFLLRTVADGHLVWRSGNNILRASAGLGGKVYFNPEVFDQDVLVFHFAAEDRVRLGRAVHLSLVGDYYDDGQLDVAPYRHRDFRTGNAMLRIHLIDGAFGEVTLAGGYRGFQYKPDPYFNFQAAQATVSAITRSQFGANGDHELDVSASYHVERRFYAGVVEYLDAAMCPWGHPIAEGCLKAGTALRHDWVHDGALELTYVGPLLVALGYAAQLDLANSFGYSYFRNLFTLKVAYRLPWSVYATVKAQLYVTDFLDPVLLDRAINTTMFVTLDEPENRNAVIVDLERPIGSAGLAVNARYSVYTNEISPSPASFLRQLVYFGLTYRVGAR